MQYTTSDTPVQYLGGNKSQDFSTILIAEAIQFLELAKKPAPCGSGI